MRGGFREGSSGRVPRGEFRERGSGRVPGGKFPERGSGWGFRVRGRERRLKGGSSGGFVEKEECRREGSRVGVVDSGPGQRATSGSSWVGESWWGEGGSGSGVSGGSRK